jgi:oligopeptide/dipeptide ABC transporter ATP-binding protein
MPAEPVAQAGLPTPLLRVRGLVKHFPIMRGVLLPRPAGAVRAVDGLDFDIADGETLALVGESGCGKTTTGRLVLRMVEPSAGTIHFAGEDLIGLEPEAMRRRRQQMQIIFQDPYGSLDPRMTVSEILDEPLRIHRAGDRAARARRVADLLDVVGLRKEYAGRYPHEFSGGQRQRIGIARALALKPRFIVCDEPVSALDVSIQAQIVNLMLDLQKDFGLTYLFIAHDLGVVKHVADRVAVMYLGRIVETADKASLYRSPQHPYTQALLAAVPIPRPSAKQALAPLKGEIPSPSNPPPGCHFHTRCPHAQERCREEAPPLRRLAQGHWASCHLLAPAA